MIVKVALSFVAAILFLFFFWRKLKEDYTQNQIFTTGFYSLFGIFIFSIISNYFIPSYTFWISMMGSLVGLTIGVYRYNFKFFESLEAWALGSLNILLVLYVFELLYRFQFADAVAILVIIFFIFLFLMLDKYYKRFVWYRSGKVGFSGLMVIGFLFLVRCLIAITLPDMLFFVGKVDAVISAVLAFASFLTLFNLSRES